jgi:hypothetical protein
MKKLIILLAINALMCKTSVAQSPIKDTIMEKRVALLEKQTLYIQTSNEKFYKEYTAGVAIQLIGAGLSGLAIATGNPKNEGAAMGFLGMSLIGTVIVIDSHKYMRRIGWSKDKYYR